MLNKFFCGSILFLLLACSSSDDSPETNNNLPQVQLNNISNITSNSASVSGSVSSEGGSIVTAKGFVWGTNSNPDLGDNSMNLGNGSGSFSGDLSELLRGTNYFIRAYATNSNGTSYSGEQSFSTLQDCDNVADGNIFVSNQEQVNNIGSYGFCEITGYLDIQSTTSSDPIVDLSPLSSIEKVGKLRIRGNSYLQDLDGLNITSIESILEVVNNDALININALSSVASSIQTVIVAGNLQLANLDGLSGLTNFVSLGSELPDLSIIGNASLTNIDGIQNVQGFENGIIYISNNNLLPNVNGLSNFPNTISSLTIRHNDILDDISGISHFTSLPGDVNLENNFLSDFNDLSNLSFVGGEFRLIFNYSSPNPISLSGLDNLTEVGGELIISASSTTLTNFDALQNVESVGKLTLSDIAELTNLDWLSNLVNVNGDLYIQYNDDLTDFCGLQNLVDQNGIGGQYIVNGNAFNPTLQDLIDGNCSL